MAYPDESKKPLRADPTQQEIELLPLAKKINQQKKKKSYHGLYDYVQIDFTYSSSRMASNRLTRNQVEFIFRKGKVQESFEPMKVSDLVEVMNHCVCIDYILDHVNEPLTQKLIQHLYYLLMFGNIMQLSNLPHRFGIPGGHAHRPVFLFSKIIGGLMKIGTLVPQRGTDRIVQMIILLPVNLKALPL